MRLYMCLLILPEQLPRAVSSKILFNVTNLDCVCNKTSTKRGLFNKARNAVRFPGLIPILLMSAGEFPPCLVCWFGLIWVRELKICLCRQVDCSTALCQSLWEKQMGQVGLLSPDFRHLQAKGGKEEHSDHLKPGA